MRTTPHTHGAPQDGSSRTATTRAHKQFVAFAAAALTFSLCGSAQALTIIDVEADTYVSYSTTTPETNYGTEATLNVSNDAGSYGVVKNGDRWSIFRFDVSGLDSSTAFSSVLLTLEQTAGDSATFDLYGIADLGADEDFDELTYSYASTSYTVVGDGDQDFRTDGGLDKEGLLQLGSFTTIGAQVVQFTSPELDAFLNADTNGMLTLILYQSTQNKSTRSFASREATTGQAPQLTVVPEPSTAAALGLALGITAFSRRRHRRE